MKHINTIRKINLIGLILASLLVLPYTLYRLGYKNTIWDIAIFGIYLFMFFSFWFFIIFLFAEIKYVITYKINFLRHIIHNKLVLWGIISFLLFLTLALLTHVKK